jgi:CRISPR-associated endonuclease Csn1
MTKILGLDLGTNSIGWAVVDKEANKIIDTGVRIFTEGVVKETIGQGDKEESKNAVRRQFRQARRQHFRKRLRKIKLLEVLINHDMCPLEQDALKKWKNWDKKTKTAGKQFPDEHEFVEWLRLNPYLLRKKASNEEITRHEFGRILYHFIQRRGFLSSRKGSVSEEGAIFKGNDKMDGINETKSLLKDNSTLGENLYQIYPADNKPFKRILIDNKEARIRARYTLREMYVHEFEQIWNKQAEPLQLNKLEVSVKKVIYLETSADSPKSKQKIEKLQNKFGESNVEIDGKRLTIKKLVPFKEFLAGKIEQTEKGINFKSNESVLFWQRPLRSQKGLLGKCTFENHKFYDKTKDKWITIGSTQCPISHPDFELFRAFQFINNIRFGKSTKLNDEQKQKVLNLINKSDTSIEFGKIPKELKLTYENFNYDDKLKIPGSPTHKRIKGFFSEEQWENHYEDIWHCFYFYEDATLLKRKLIETYGLTKLDAEKASKIQLADGYGSVSLKAIRNILYFLKLGYRYSTAVVLGGVKNAFGKERWDRFEMFHDEIIRRVVQLIENEAHKEYELIGKIKRMLADPENQFGFVENDRSFQKLYHHSQAIEKKTVVKRLSEIENLRNPIVQKGLNEMRRLVNELLDNFAQQPEFGPDFSFDKIHVEMGRDLKNSKKMRQEMVFKLRENERENEDARLRLAEFGLKPSRENITKYRLYKEIQAKNGSVVCPYTRKTVKITDLLGRDNLYQIEHIVPFSVSLDDSFGNKTICESNFNRDKGELTPYEFYQKNSDPKIWGADSWEDIEQRAFALLPYRKAKKFVSKKRDEDAGFIARQLNDMRYISKKATEVLSEICDDVRVMPGQLTSELRRLWGLNNIIQPVLPLELSGYDVDPDLSLPHYLVLDQFGVPTEIRPILAKRPEKNANQILIPGFISDKNKFIADKNYRHLKFEVQTDGLPVGKYWAKLNVSEPVGFTRIFTERPAFDELSVVYRGKVLNGFFNHDSLGRKLKASVPDGTYWAKLQVKKTNLIEPEKDKQPKPNKNQVLLFGMVQDNLFTSYIYQCQTELLPGRYWALLDVDFEKPEYTKAINNPAAEHQNGELIITGAVGDDGEFLPDCDPGFNSQTSLSASRYFATVSVQEIEGFYPIENPAPEIGKEESVLLGNIWVNKQTGEIMFDPKKNRDDHRHHAVDAITIALTELGFLQKLSHYFGEMKDKERGIGDRPTFDLPWPGFDKDVKKAIDNILVSYTRNIKVLSKISKTIVKAGKKHQSIGLAARGRLHREYYFGKHPSPVLHGNDPEKGGLLFEKDKQGNLVYYYHIRKPVTSIKNDKHVKKIVDHGIRNLILKRLKEDFSIDTSSNYNIPDNFFLDSNKQPALFLPNRKGEPVPVKKVRFKEVISNAVQLKDDMNQWVNPYNNHHVVIYEDYNGDLKEQVVSFWDVIERQNQGDAIYKLPEDGAKLITTLQENDMFLINLDNEQIETIKRDSISKEELSKHLYRVQKISSMYYTFRHHLASTVTSESEEISIRSMNGWSKANAIKVALNTLGSIRIID